VSNVLRLIALISICLAISEAPAYTARPQIASASASCSVPVYTSAGTQFANSQSDGQAELTWWLVTCWAGLPICWQSPVQVLTRPTID